MEYQEYKRQCLAQIIKDSNATVSRIETSKDEDDWWFDAGRHYDALECKFCINPHNGVIISGDSKFSRCLSEAWLVWANGLSVHGNMIPFDLARVKAYQPISASSITHASGPYQDYYQARTGQFINFRTLGTFDDYCVFMPQSLLFQVRYAGQAWPARLARFKLNGNRVNVSNDLDHESMWFCDTGWPAFILDMGMKVVPFPLVEIVNARASTDAARDFVGQFLDLIGSHALTN